VLDSLPIAVDKIDQAVTVIDLEIQERDLIDIDIPQKDLELSPLPKRRGEEATATVLNTEDDGSTWSCKTFRLASARNASLRRGEEGLRSRPASAASAVRR
jgi:hypothetical protein